MVFFFCFFYFINRIFGIDYPHQVVLFEELEKKLHTVEKSEDFFNSQPKKDSDSGDALAQTDADVKRIVENVKIHATFTLKKLSLTIVNEKYCFFFLFFLFFLTQY